MSLMLKLLAITLLLNSSVFAQTRDERVEEFLENSFSNNPNIVTLEVHIVEKVAVESMKDWNAYIVDINASVKSKPQNRQVKQKMIWFSNGEVITQDLVNLTSGESLKELVSPNFKPEYYKKENLIYGNPNAKHKVAIFSDPLCPFCRDFVPKAVNFMKKDSDKFAVYYYHFPLQSIHPASVTLVKAAIAAELKGYKNAILDLYTVEVQANEKDVTKILTAFNRVFKTDIKPSDLELPAVIEHYNSDQSIAGEVMVQGTPTMFFDGKLDKSKRQYERIK
ncbi:MAG: disulfide bond formation protein DsbA [Helicobacteraceae bacterium CG2_30_36_10]|nr:MAG: disulfide bond formation protein DsbA [Helicobacteraceae bacterium CG2_30_36_10]